MGTVVYSSLLTLFLDEDDYSLKDITDMAREKYDFSGENFEMQMRLTLHMIKLSGDIEEISNNNLHKKRDFCSNLYMMLGGPENLPEGYLERFPLKRKQFYIDLEERYGKNYRKKEKSWRKNKIQLDNEIPF